MGIQFPGPLFIIFMNMKKWVHTYLASADKLSVLPDFLNFLWNINDVTAIDAIYVRDFAVEYGFTERNC